MSNIAPQTPPPGSEYAPRHADHTRKFGLGKQVSRKSWTILGTIIVVVALFAANCSGTNPHATPRSMSEHQPENSASAPANQNSGTCHILSKGAINAAFGGETSSGVADNLTAGLDRCNWTLTNSRLSRLVLTLTAYRAPTSSAIHKTRAATGLIPITAPGLSGATFDPTHWILAYRTATGTRYLQLIAPAAAHLKSAPVEAAMVRVLTNRS